MKTTTFGTIVSAYRKKYGLRQRAICKGVCPESTCVRAELEGIEVDFLTQEALLARMGLSADDFELLLGDEDYVLRSRRGAIRSDLAGRNWMELEKKLDDYISNYRNKDKTGLHRQFYLYYQVKLAQWRGDNPDKICKLAEEALSCTKESDEVPHPKDNLYSHTELDLLLTLIQYEFGSWQDPFKSGDCLKKIIDYVGVYYATERQEDIEGRAWIQLIKVAEKFENTDKLLSYIDKAIDCFSGATGIERLAEVRFIKAKLLWKSCDEVVDKEKQIELCTLCREECRMAYCIFEVLGRGEKVQEVEAFCEEKLQWHITMQMK